MTNSGVEAPRAVGLRGTSGNPRRNAREVQRSPVLSVGTTYGLGYTEGDNVCPTTVRPHASCHDAGRVDDRRDVPREDIRRRFCGGLPYRCSGGVKDALGQ